MNQVITFLRFLHRKSSLAALMLASAAIAFPLMYSLTTSQYYGTGTVVESEYAQSGIVRMQSSPFLDPEVETFVGVDDLDSEPGDQVVLYSAFGSLAEEPSPFGTAFLAFLLSGVVALLAAVVGGLISIPLRAFFAQQSRSDQP